MSKISACRSRACIHCIYCGAAGRARCSLVSDPVTLRACVVERLGGGCGGRGWRERKETRSFCFIQSLGSIVHRQQPVPQLLNRSPSALHHAPHTPSHSTHLPSSPLEPTLSYSALKRQTSCALWTSSRDPALPAAFSEPATLPSQRPTGPSGRLTHIHPNAVVTPRHRISTSHASPLHYTHHHARRSRRCRACTRMRRRRRANALKRTNGGAQETQLVLSLSGRRPSHPTQPNPGWGSCLAALPRIYIPCSHHQQSSKAVSYTLQTSTPTPITRRAPHSTLAATDYPAKRPRAAMAAVARARASRGSKTLMASSMPRTKTTTMSVTSG